MREKTDQELVKEALNLPDISNPLLELETKQQSRLITNAITKLRNVKQVDNELHDKRIKMCLDYLFNDNSMKEIALKYNLSQRNVRHIIKHTLVRVYKLGLHKYL